LKDSENVPVEAPAIGVKEKGELVLQHKESLEN